MPIKKDGTGKRAGRPAAFFLAMTSVSGDNVSAWKRLIAQLSLTAADAGERRTTASRPEALSGVIERVLQQPHERVLEMRHATARASAGQQKWQAWLDERFAPSLA